MANYNPAASKLNAKAEEYFPISELKEKALAELRGAIEEALNRSSKFSEQTYKLKLFAEVNQLNSASLVGEVLAQSSVATPKRVTIGFRYFKEVRAKLSVTLGNNFESGVFSALREMVRKIISDSLIDKFYESSWTHKSKLCIATGDVPKRLDAKSVDNIFAIIAFLRLIITNLNTDSNSGYVCVPPLQPSEDFCILIENICRIHCLKSHINIPCEDENPMSTLAESMMELSLQQTWWGLLYSAFEGFHQGLVYVNALLTQMNLGALQGTWQRTGSADEQIELISEGQVATDGFSSILSTSVNRTLTYMRQLLVRSQLPMRLLRSTLLDVLLCASELACLQASSYRAVDPYNISEYDFGLDINLSNESLNDFDDEKSADYQQFLRESGQLE